MENKLYYLHYDHFSIGLTADDILSCTKGSDHTDGCKKVSKKDYVISQLKNVRTEIIVEQLYSVGITIENENDREEVLLLIIWDCANYLKEDVIRDFNIGHVLDEIYNDEKALKSKIEKTILLFLKSEKRTTFRFECPIIVSNNEDIEGNNNGHIIGVVLGDNDAVEIHATFDSEYDTEDPEVYDIDDFYIEDLSEVVAHLASHC